MVGAAKMCTLRTMQQIRTKSNLKSICGAQVKDFMTAKKTKATTKKLKNGQFWGKI